MDLYVFGDESGTFDPDHYPFYAFGGLLCFGREQKDDVLRRYLAAERTISDGREDSCEVKAATILPKERVRLFKAAGRAVRFAAVIDQDAVDPRILASKRTKQRYLDYVFTSAFRSCLEGQFALGAISPADVGDVVVTFDDHKTSTNGRYELQARMASELKDGIVTHRGEYVEPLLPGMGDVKVAFADSRGSVLVRAADIVANAALRFTLEGKRETLAAKTCLSEYPAA